MDDFCREKGIKREYSVARTLQQNGITQRRNRTLIVAARTMLADSKLPTTFWTEAVSTACYVQNRVLVVKPHNKTPYELFRGFKPALSFMRPFGCHVTILNTLDSLGKFDGKSDEGIVSNDSASTLEENSQDCIVMPIWKDTSYFDSPTKTVDNGEQKTADDAQKQVKDGLNNENAKKERFADDSSSKDVNAVGQQVNTASLDVNTGSLKLNAAGLSVSTASPNKEDNTKEESEVDLGNITNSYIVPNTPNTRIHKYHPIDNVIGEVQSTVQTRRMSKPTSEQGFLSDIKPTSIAKALSDSSWVEAMQEELLQFKLQQVWILVDLPNGKKGIGKKWVFRNRKRMGGIVIRIKPRITEILKKFNYSDVKSALTPIDLEKPLVKDGDADDVDVHLYRSMIRSLMYLTASWPDIMFAAWYSRDSPFELVAYTDSDYAGATLDRKSITGGCQFLGNRLISWQCKKQTVVATSTNEAEYVAAASCCRQVSDEAVHKELGDKMERAATTASSLEAKQDSGSGPRCQDTILGDVNAQTRFKLVLSLFVYAVERMLMLSVQVSVVEVNPVIYTSCIEQFWATAKVQTVNGVRQLQALVDKKRVIVTESSIRRDLHLNDAEGTDCLPTATIFEELTRMSGKSTASNEFSSSMASLIICLATNQKFNLSKYIFDAMVKHLDGGIKFLFFANMKRAGKDFSRRITPLFDTLVVLTIEALLRIRSIH
ncbi:putative ribonuclease H-like domain-containing protein [Tanacetum coccineum]